MQANARKTKCPQQCLSWPQGKILWLNISFSLLDILKKTVLCIWHQGNYLCLVPWLNAEVVVVTEIRIPSYNHLVRGGGFDPKTMCLTVFSPYCTEEI